MLIIGLCGSSGSGKGTVGRIFSEYGIPNIDTDAVYSEITSYMSPCLEELAREFGKEIISENNTLNRDVLRKKVFDGDSSHKKRLILNRIAHKFILDETKDRLEKFKMQGLFAVIVDAPLLFESGFDKLCDVIISVVADRERCISRIILRDGISSDDAKKRLATQLSSEELIRLSHFVIENNGDESELKLAVKNVYQNILDKFSER